MEENSLNVNISYSNNFLANSSFKYPFFNVLFLNIRGLKSKLNELTFYVNASKVPQHIIVLNETFVNSYETHLFNLPGYTTFHSTRAKDKGGVAIFIKNDFSTANALESEEYENGNLLIVHLDRFNFKVGTFYKPPDMNFASFRAKLELTLSKYNQLFFFGDMNINLFAANDKKVTDYVETVETNGYKLLNSLDPSMFTRENVTNNSITCIDHVLTDEFLVYDFHFSTDSILKSDHKAIRLEVYKQRPFKLTSLGKLLTFRQTNHQKIINDNDLAVVSSQSFEKFMNDFTKILAQNTTSTTVRQKFKKPFMNAEIYDYMIIRDNYYKLSSKHPSSSIARSRYKRYRNLVIALIRDSKKKSFCKIIRDNLSDPRKTWQNLNNIIRNRDDYGSSESCSKLVINNKLFSTKIDVCNAFNFHFSTVASSIRQKLRSTVNLPLSQTSSVIPFQFDPALCTTEEVEEIISNMSNSSAMDAYSLSNKILKIHRAQVSHILSNLINEAVEKSLFPDVLKLAIVKPLHKGGDKLNPSNYRPIAILPIISKVFESFIAKRLTSHLSRNEIIDDFQFGFVQKSNTETATLHLLSRVYDNLERKLFTAILFIDISKAFDCVDYDLLLNKLKTSGIDGKFLSLFKSYFTNREQFVEIDSTRSPKTTIKCGVPQGSILGPILFILYINDVFKLGLVGSIQLYADDAKIVYGCLSLNELKSKIEHDLRLIRNFFNSLMLDLNASKTKCLIFQGRHSASAYSNCNIQVIFDSQVVEMVDSYNCLGLWLDAKLSFEKHIMSVYNKNVAMTYAIKRTRPFLSEKLCYQLYYAHIYSQLIYLIPLWSATNDKSFLKLYNLQKRCLRFIQRKDPLSPSKELFSYKVLPLPVISDYNLLILAFKIKNGLIKNNVALNYVRDIHSRGTRHSLSENFYVVTPKSKFGQADFYRRGLIKYNELHDDVKRLHSLSLFKRRVREMLFEDFMAT
jgi:Reverse transcriptase (RNA-dependent DNA polymerase)